MPIQTTYTQARANLATLLNEVTNNRETVIIQRRRSESVAMISAEELSGLLETAHLLRSPKNAERLIAALGKALKGKRKSMSLEQLRRGVGLEREKA
jgi:antitoxin YefM